MCWRINKDLDISLDTHKMAPDIQSPQPREGPTDGVRISNMLISPKKHQTINVCMMLLVNI